MVRVFPDTNLLSHVLRKVYVGVDSNLFNSVYASQKSANWCWAACIEMITRYYGVPVDQKYFAQAYCGIDFFGNAKDCPAPVDIITENLNLRLKTHQLSSCVKYGAPTANQLYNLLKDGRPVVVAYAQSPQKGHAVLVTGLSYQETILGGNLSSIVVRDPDPDYFNQLMDGRKEYSSNAQLFMNSIYAWWVPNMRTYVNPIPQLG